MARFSTAPLQEVVPPPITKGPSQRALLQEEYREALKNALDVGEALVLDLEPDDKPLTIRNRLTKAAHALGREDLTIRRKRNRILAYHHVAEKST